MLEELLTSTRTELDMLEKEYEEGLDPEGEVNLDEACDSLVQEVI